MTAPPSSPPALGGSQQFLALDVSKNRVGVASGNGLMRQATPLKTLTQTGEARWAALAQLQREWGVDAWVVGIARHPDGAPNENTQALLDFAAELRTRSRKPVHEVDERYTTVEARALGAKDVDASAAALILDQFFQGLPP